MLGLLLAASCEPELPGAVRFIDDDAETQTKSLSLIISREDWPGTKTSLGSDVESIFSGAVLAAYDASTGLLDSELEIGPEAIGGRIEMSLPAGRSYNLYLLGNLWEIGSGGAKRAPAFPADEASLEDFHYRMDGGAAEGGYRREQFSDAALYGIPLCWSQLGVSASASGVSVRMKRLFSRLIVTVDHSGMAGSSLDAFVNGSLTLRQVNCRLMPFASGGSRALEAGDVLPQGDADATMKNALCEEFVYYVPENRQGVLLPGNDDPSRKTLDNVEPSRRGLVSYVEFKADLGAASGFEGSAVYRFLLGRDAVTDFDIERGLSFRVGLGFDAESIFSPEWKVEVDGLTDRREFYLSGELAGRLPEGKTVVVRKNRPAVLDLNLELAGRGANIISSARLVDGGYRVSSLTDLAWTSDFWSATHDSANEPQREALAALGIAVSYAGGRFLFKVSDPSRFAPGRSVPLSLTLYPGGRVISAEIVTREDIKVSGDSGAPEDPIYVAQCRTLSFSGFEGGTLYYIADQSSTSGGKHIYNTHWKASPSLSAEFPGYYKLASDNSVVYPFSDPDSYASQSIPADGTLQLCCFSPTDSRALNGQSAPGSIIICSDDPLNDGLVTIPLNIILPKLKKGLLYKTVIPFDGNEVDIGMSITDTDGSPLDAADFHPVLAEALLAPTATYDKSAYPWLANLAFDLFSGKAYLARTTLETSSGPLKLEEEFPYDTSRPDPTFSLGSLVLKAPSLLVKSGDTASSLSLTIALSIPRLGESTDDYKDQWWKYLNDIGEDTMRNHIKCYQQNGDVSRFEFSHSGEGNSFKCQSGKELHPVTEGEYNGSQYIWSYKESSQPTRVDGEYVPGGLILPYGTQTVTLAVTNKWDGRKLVSSSSFTVRHSADLNQVGLFHNAAAATVYPLPQRNINYLMSLSGKVPVATLRWMLKVLDSDTWLKHYLSGPDFLINGKRMRDLPSYGSQFLWSRGNFPVKYFDAGAGKWTEALAKKSFENPGDIWLDFLHDDKGSNGLKEDQAITGNPYLQLFYGTTRGGYVYINSTKDPWFL